MHRGIDHLVIAAHDLDDLSALYRRLGFTVTPRAHHDWGTDNALVQLQGNFLELLTVAYPEKLLPERDGHFDFGRHNQRFLASKQGMSMLVYESCDALADREEFIERGLPDWANFHFSREAKLPDGGTATVSFSLAFASEPSMPLTGFFTCQQHAPELFWKPQYQEHANTAQVVSEVIMVADTPRELGDYLAAMQEPESLAVVSDNVQIDTPRGVVSVLSPGAAQARFGPLSGLGASTEPRFLGFAIQVADIGKAEQVLSSAGVAYSQRDGRLQLAPEVTSGSLVEFHE